MSRPLLMVGLDCLGAELLAPETLADLPHLRRLAAGGLSGSLRSTLPPITVPAWTSMLSGRDPGELGIYGFRNRRSYAYDDLVYATSAAVRFPRLWDYVGQAGGKVIVVGVPQTWPPPAVQGALVAGFEAGRAAVQAGLPFTHPPALADEVAKIAGDYLFDVQNFRNVAPEQVIEQVYAMTEQRFRLMAHLLQTRPWQFAMLCEIGPDRLHHCFWSDHDPAHPRHRPDSPYRQTIRQYYRFLDDHLGRLLAVAGADAAILLASDHGAQPMHGGVCINEALRRWGWLRLRSEPDRPTPLRPDLVDWSASRAWSSGGYYARIFLNVQGREPQGIIPPDQRDEARRQLTGLLSTLALPGGPTLANQVVWPERAYRRVRGLAPDLLVFFQGLSWRSLGSVGHDRLWLVGNDTGLDEANHAYDGFYILSGPGAPAGIQRPASILDIAPTALNWMGLAAPEDLTGRSLLAGNGASP